jgi:hypothetical protein
VDDAGDQHPEDEPGEQAGIGEQLPAAQDGGAGVEAHAAAMPSARDCDAWRSS